MEDIEYGEASDIGQDIDETPEDVGLDIGPRFVEDEIAPDCLTSEQSNETRDEVSEPMLESESPHIETQSDTLRDRIQPAAMKGAALSTAALGVMGVSSLMHAQKVEAPTMQSESTPIIEQIEPGEVAFNLEEEATEQAADGQKPTVVRSKVETAEFEARWWHDVPVTSQQGLQYNETNTQYGCAPTAVSMVLDYWHSQDPANPTMSAQALLDANVVQGTFKGKGMSITNIHDEVTNLGYERVEDFANADLDILRQHVEQGPVVAAVKLGMGTDGNNHSVVVTGISEDNQVRINDPWKGESKTYSWDEFSRSWGADFGSTSKNHFTVIRPI